MAWLISSSGCNSLIGALLQAMYPEFPVISWDQSFMPFCIQVGIMMKFIDTITLFQNSDIADLKYWTW
jgi:hypothetical protein